MRFLGFFAANSSIVAAWIEVQQQECAAPTVKLRLAAIRHLFDWLVTGQMVRIGGRPSPPSFSSIRRAHADAGDERAVW